MKRLSHSRLLTQWLKQLNGLLQASLPLLTALLLIQQDQRRFYLFSNVVHDIQAGKSLADSLSRCFLHTEKTTLHLIQTGEKAGCLTEVLSQLIIYREFYEHTQQTLLKSLSYPIFLLGMTLLMSMVMLTTLVPQFTALYESVHADLPGITQGVIAILHQLPFLLFFILLLISVMLFRRRFTSHTGFYFYRLLQHLPIIKLFLTDLACAHWYTHMALCFNAQVSLLDALQLSETSYGQRWLRVPMHTLEQGHSLSEILRHTGHLSHTDCHRIELAEQSGTLRETFQHLSQEAQTLLHQRLQRLSTWMEPVMMIMVSIVIGCLVLALYWPIFQLGKVIHV